SDIETCVYDEIILLLLHRMLNLEILHLAIRKVSLFDEHPFEHEFFLRIAQSLNIFYLKELDLIHTYRDYHEQFLLDTKTCLPFDVLVSMQYELSKKVTHTSFEEIQYEVVVSK
ncbi:unnamed protein product, partial [Rotaria socialis]